MHAENASLADRLIGDDDASLGQQIFDSPEVEAEAIVEPHGVADDQRREAVIVLARCHLTHETILRCSPSKLTVPFDGRLAEEVEKRLIAYFGEQVALEEWKPFMELEAELGACVGEVFRGRAAKGAIAARSRQARRS